LAPRFRDDSTLTLKMVLDKTSIELFMDEGETVMTEIFFPQAPYEKVVVSADQKTVTKISAAYIEFKPQQE
jgi:fructan beta-fructosidase